jgi:hydrogenase maturation protein HypF
MVSSADTTIRRRHIRVQGIVQGVGFRPFVYGLAHSLNLTGFVLNDSEGVIVEIEGSLSALDIFERELRQNPPPLARIDSIVVTTIPEQKSIAFIIEHSQVGNERATLISPDTATCDACLGELRNPDDRRYRYPFTNCTNCGPRFTIVQDVPYDRDKTTMRVFPMCADCQHEYENPLDRRFHAQPNACPVCGPHVSLLDGNGMLVTTDDAISTAATRLAEGAILAIKGLGGYHLACDALNTDAVQRLRSRKHRDAKPFALMVPDRAIAEQLCYVSDAEGKLLESQRRPIVLLDQLPNCPMAPGVAPGYRTLGIMLPYTPLHHLLFDAYRSVTGERLPVLVMTSGNLSDEPIAYGDDDARARLFPLVEGMLTHNRDIHMRCDDTVMRVVASSQQFMRRSRGYAPEPIALSADLSTHILASGAHLKNTFCLAKGRNAFVSHHIGDLENLETLTSYREGIAHFARIFDIVPTVVAYDLHPEYLATKYAMDLDLPRKIGVQHHHAHIASVLAEQGLTGPVIGIAADGTGYGVDGAIWGGEILVADCAGFHRFAHLDYLPLSGGDQAVRQPWRVAATWLQRAYGDDFLDLDLPFTRQIDKPRWRTIRQMIARGINSPLTSSMGRLFDAVAALIGLRGEVVYEGQAAIELEALAMTCDSIDGLAPYPFLIQPGEPARMDVVPMIRAIVDDVRHEIGQALIARCFHETIAALLAEAAVLARAAMGLEQVALSGGVFQNRLLLESLNARLHALGFLVFTNHLVPPNDGGISLGQIAVASAIIQQEGV